MYINKYGPFSNSLTYSLTYSLTHSLAHSFTRSLAHSLAHSLRRKLSSVIPLTNAWDFRGKGIVDRRKKGHFESSALMFLYLESLNGTLKPICRLEMDFQ